MPQGTVTKIVADRGFGFISAEPREVFFHHSSVADAGFDNLREGQTVEYEIEEDGGSRRGGKGPRASSVKVV
jgi:cold shock CspA family protein